MQWTEKVALTVNYICYVMCRTRNKEPVMDLDMKYTLEIYSGGGPSTYVFCVVCYHVMTAHM